MAAHGMTATRRKTIFSPRSPIVFVSSCSIVFSWVNSSGKISLMSRCLMCWFIVVWFVAGSYVLDRVELFNVARDIFWMRLMKCGDLATKSDSQLSSTKDALESDWKAASIPSHVCLPLTLSAFFEAELAASKTKCFSADSYEFRDFIRASFTMVIGSWVSLRSLWINEASVLKVLAISSKELARINAKMK